MHLALITHQKKVNKVFQKRSKKNLSHKKLGNMVECTKIGDVYDAPKYFSCLN